MKLAAVLLALAFIKIEKRGIKKENPALNIHTNSCITEQVTVGTRIQMIGNNEARKGAAREKERVKKTGGDGLKLHVQWRSLPFSSSVLLLTSVKNAACVWMCL